jgi:hypothetical protein
MKINCNGNKARVIFGQLVIYNPYILRIEAVKKPDSLMRGMWLSRFPW